MELLLTSLRQFEVFLHSQGHELKTNSEELSLIQALHEDPAVQDGGGAQALGEPADPMAVLAPTGQGTFFSF